MVQSQPLITIRELSSRKGRWSVLGATVLTGLGAAVLVFLATWLVLAWPTVVMNLKWASGVPLGPADVADRATAPVVAPNHLLIPRLGVDAPVLYDTEVVDAVGRLPDGVVHIRGTALPGQIGTSFIVGHSSGYWWQRGVYTQVFALLDKLEPDDQFWVNAGGETFEYQVVGRRTVRPTQVNVLAQSTTEARLTLMTCSPVGTTLNRLLVEATLVRKS